VHGDSTGQGDWERELMWRRIIPVGGGGRGRPVCFKKN